MVAPVDIHVVFSSADLFDRLKDAIEAHSSGGSGAVLADLYPGVVSAAVERGRVRAAGAPLGVVATTEAEALEAITAGADEAVQMTGVDDAEITAFLDRVRLRGRARRSSEKLVQDFAHAEKLMALGTIVAGVGHEMNNPLSAIGLSVELLEHIVLPDMEVLGEIARDGGAEPAQQLEALRRLGEHSADVRQLLNEISSAAESVTQLVGDLRVFSRTGRIEEPAIVSPRLVIEQALRLVRREFSHRAVVERDYDENLPDLYLPRNRLTQVLMNILVNAAHAIRDVPREVHRIRLGARVDEQHMAISISDTGPGIPPDALEKIFDPFYTTKREGHGTGLGLSISRSILEQMGGDLVVSSVYGDGATFICLLPLATEEQLQSARLESPLPRMPDLRTGYSVLLVDDDERVLRALARVLEGSYKVLIARDGREALELLSSGSHADALLMELDLPEMDGVELHKWLRSERPELAARVVAATGAHERPRFQAFLEREGLTVLHKPLGRENVLRAVHRVLTGGR